MLVKAELKKVPLCECPTFSKKELQVENALAAASSVCDLPRSGKILVVDYYNAKSRELQGRFFSDGRNYVSFLPGSESWSDRAPENVIGVVSLGTAECQREVNSFLKVKFYTEDQKHYSLVTHGYVSGPMAACAKFADAQRNEKNNRRRERKEDRERYHFSMFPYRYPHEIYEYLDHNIFQNTYIVFTKLNKSRRRQGHCVFCGKSFSLPAETKHNSTGQCPKCGRAAVMCAEWIGTRFQEKITFCLPIKNDNNLLLEWSTVERTMDKGEKKPTYIITPFARTLYMNENGKKKIYSYGISNNPYGYYYGWSSWGSTPVYRKAFVYTDVLSSVFGNRYYNVDLERALTDQQEPLDFVGLLDNLKHIPQAEYLCKCGMVKFASEIKENEMNPNGKSFSDAFGVPQQYQRLYREYSVSFSEHKKFQIACERLTGDLIDQYRALYKESARCGSLLGELWERMTLHKIEQYSRSQKELSGASLQHVLIWMADTYDMNEKMGVVLNKSNLYPPDIQAAHDIVLKRYNQVRNQIDQEHSKKVLAQVNRFYKGFQKDGLSAIMPQSRRDFIKEGQELSHCVGSDRYYENHIKGRSMIFFVRRSTSPEKAYYTAEINMTSYIVVQCYGYGDCKATKEVKSFVNSLAGYLKRICENDSRKAG